MISLVLPALPLAHAGHWFASILYLMPVLILGGGIAWQRHRDRKLQQSGGAVAKEDVPFTDE